MRFLDDVERARANGAVDETVDDEALAQEHAGIIRRARQNRALHEENRALALTVGGDEDAGALLVRELRHALEQLFALELLPLVVDRRLRRQRNDFGDQAN